MDYLNVPLAAAVTSWLLAQAIKTVTYMVKNKKFNHERMFGPGGMPSSHSATVCSLLISISYVEGPKSAEFAIAMVLAMVVMYDAIGVRRSAGFHAKEINRLKRIIAEFENKPDNRVKNEQPTTTEIEDEYDESYDDGGDEHQVQKELKEILGHTPIEVIFGALLGILVGMLFSM